VASAEAYLRIKLHLDPSSRLAATDVVFLGVCPLARGELGPHLTQFGEGRGLRPIRAKFHLDPSSRLATTDVACFFFGGGGCAL